MALAHEEPDRVPIGWGYTFCTIEEPAYESLKTYLNVKKPTKRLIRLHVTPDEEIMQRFKVDTRHVGRIRLPKSLEPKIDEWGVGWQRNPTTGYYDVAAHPLENATIDDLEHYPWPDAEPEMVSGLQESAKKLRETSDYAIVAHDIGYGVFEEAQHLRGVENLFYDLLQNPEFVEVLLDKVLETEMKLIGLYLGAVGEYVDICAVEDDLGGQDGPLISPKLYRRLIKPRDEKLISFVRKKTKAKVLYHSCGGIYPFIGDLIEIGVDILNPIQILPKGMDSRKLKKDFGDKLSFWGGGCDTQKMLIFGTPAEIENHVRDQISKLALGGGFIFSPDHSIQANVPLKNICTMFDAAMKYGSYPISN